MTKLEAAKLVTVLMAAFPHSDSTVHTSTTFETGLADLEYQVADRAVRRLIATAKHRPTLGEIREAAVELQLGPRRQGADGWGDVLKAVSKFGAYRKPVFEDPLVARAVEAFGWQAICASEEQVADRARFIQLYDSYASVARRELQIPEPLRVALPEAPKSAPKSIAAILKSLPMPDGDA